MIMRYLFVIASILILQVMLFHITLTEAAECYNDDEYYDGCNWCNCIEGHYTCTERLCSSTTTSVVEE
ncbi:hypothetical protein C0J52_16539 [Blattella germanica]|nr:hypothetical protein C0J52_16539 [Blattella germanica]